MSDEERHEVPIMRLRGTRLLLRYLLLAVPRCCFCCRCTG